MARSLLETAPAEPHAGAKQRLAEAVETRRELILDVSHRIHANPEPAFEEHQAAAWVAEAVRAHGYEVEHPAGRLATAVRGRLTGGYHRPPRGAEGGDVGPAADPERGDEPRADRPRVRGGE